MVLLSALLAFGAFPGLAQDATMAASTSGRKTAAGPAAKPASWGVPEGRTFLPRNWVRGYVDFDVAPKRNSTTSPSAIT